MYPESNGCPCINSSEILSLRSNCKLENGLPGVLGVSNVCYPVTYGSDVCDTHDNQVDPRCSSSEIIPPDFCDEPFCYIDNNACKLSTEIFFGSRVFDGLYYSYSRCNSTKLNLFIAPTEGIHLEATVPTISYPNHYKLTESGEIANYPGEEYYNDQIRWRGMHIDYFNAVVGISNIAKVAYTHRSRGSDVAHPESAWTAAVYEIHAGISCIAISNFWITAERLKLSMFTVPVTTDKLYLFIEIPGLVSDTNFANNMQKVLMPFDTKLWYFLIFVLILVSMLGVVFANERGDRQIFWRKFHSRDWREASCLSRAWMTLKIVVDANLHDASSALQGGISIDLQNSLPQKWLNFGFCLLSFVVISAYTANLAAFLTLSMSNQKDYITNMNDAVSKGVAICASPTLKAELTMSWPDAKFVFESSRNAAQLKLFDDGSCVAIISSLSDLLISSEQMKSFCDRELVMSSDAPVLEMAVGFPVCTKIAADISHWIYEAERCGVSFEAFEERNRPDQICSFDMPEKSKVDKMARLTVNDLSFPISAFLFFTLVAIFFHAWGWEKRKLKRAEKYKKSDRRELEHKSRLYKEMCVPREEDLSIEEENHVSVTDEIEKIRDDIDILQLSRDDNTKRILQEIDDTKRILQSLLRNDNMAKRTIFDGEF